jgi:hypothetical protein
MNWLWLPLIFVAAPLGADPDSPLAGWYRSLRTSHGVTCCDVSDCRPVTARRTADGWEIVIYKDDRHEVWEAVPPVAVLRRENPTGGPVACRSLQLGTRCFVPPPEF